MTTQTLWRFSVCVEMIFRDLPFAERLDAVAAQGPPAFEFWRLADKDVDAIAARQQALGLACSAFAANSAALVDPQQRPRFLEEVQTALSVAQRLNCPNLIVLAGNELPGVARAAQHDSIVEGLRAAAPLAEAAGVTLALEPLNTRVDHAGYYLESSEEGFAIVDKVNSPAVRLLYDIYHQQISEGRLTMSIRENLARIGHIHVADVPGRHEPGTGEINYAHLFQVLTEIGYDRFVGLEFRPRGDHGESLQATQRLASAA